ncbi:hypothetical protein FSC05_02730 [Acinetobacter indicus]|uniref:Zinc ribbon domain-containing protein n=1 Tax=Acinetobacter indicus TaxID=756892 RepID=A0AAW8Z8B6_9GAMM|nr:hypothetical protein [Acinetobacter indicus]MDM1269149.1 hypothetical protein [Acinetobacter indicus]MDV4316526.1 hypothetical protein [Acinetobacter indicus]QFS18164.1 hypothetical protein FHP22_12055 [Acinetobacter indicus]QIC72717.1 hypothetical protein FSC05_02730 [Acinetobacter indicus]UNW03800.1 hypothetical protein MOW12_12020 [Acinetobacter indicus]
MKPLFCVSCGQQRQEHHHFCAYCGYHFQSDATQITTAPKNRREYHFEPNADELKAYDKHANFLRYCQLFSYIVAAGMIYLGIILPDLLRMLGLYGFSSELYSLGGMVIAVVAGVHQLLARYILGIGYPHKFLSLKEFYHNLSSAKNRFDKPCCIFCGHHSFYKKGVYQTENDRLVYCAKCDSYLYDEPEIPWYRVWT